LHVQARLRLAENQNAGKSRPALFKASLLAQNRVEFNLLKILRCWSFQKISSNASRLKPGMGSCVKMKRLTALGQCTAKNRSIDLFRYYEFYPLLAGGKFDKTRVSRFDTCI